MKTLEKTIYRCDHCGKNYFIKSACERHEPKCPKNEINKRQCFGCGNLTKKIIPYYFDTFQGESKRMVNVFFCEKIDSALHPPHSNDPFEFGDVSNEEMKKECEQYENINEMDSETDLFFKTTNKH